MEAGSLPVAERVNKEVEKALLRDFPNLSLISNLQSGVMLFKKIDMNNLDLEKMLRVLEGVFSSFGFLVRIFPPLNKCDRSGTLSIGGEQVAIFTVTDFSDQLCFSFSYD